MQYPGKVASLEVELAHFPWIAVLEETQLEVCRAVLIELHVKRAITICVEKAHLEAIIFR